MEKPNELERAVELGDYLLRGQETVEKAREELKVYTDPRAIDFLQTVMDEYSLKIAG